MTRTILEIAIFVLLVILDGFGYLPISQTLFIIPFIWMSLRLRKERFKSIGLSFDRTHAHKSIILGIILGILLEIFATYITTPILSGYFGADPALSEFRVIKGNLQLLFLFIALSWILAAFGEEICFRGFLMNRIARLFGNTNVGWVISLILSSILFGWGHTEQGITGWIQEGLSGLFLGIIFIKSNKNLTIPIVSHGVSNSFAFVLMYFGNYPGIE